jgi:8-oxo-dGTP pyrophosphatase MutT (NUDIX family)
VTDRLVATGQTGPPPTRGSESGVEAWVEVQLPDLPDTARRAAVLVALFEEAGEARVLLTRRSSHLRAHRGEVSFPGGRIDPGEAVGEAALREAAEEVDLDPGDVSVVGWLHPVLTFASGSHITPVVATLAGRPRLEANPAEVERVFDVALAQLAAPGVFHEERWRIPGRDLPGSSDGSFAVWFYEAEGELIWGATARMLTELLALVLGVELAPGDRPPG